MFPFAHYALAHAQAGDFELLDALELLDEDRQSFDKDSKSYPFLYGIWKGGRLQLFAYGNDYDDEFFFLDCYEDFFFPSCAAFFVTDFNKNILYDEKSFVDWSKTSMDEENRLCDSVTSCVERDQDWATSVLEKFQEKIKPTEGE